ncbi:beta-lactamase family protein [Parvularcula sp. ZS-1/3]|uniref:Beta-lactamase family protein n=1 Tax=Parvularcula mediterranea TaxID=2732508 RepID=A0A7Y3W5L8_9PROT|nr:serine hydrolase domain-containing protein [Parvularcula mediterranea]NNU16895.1 beta-lactamase family protein [Parvularcula mediterranea]
MRRLFLTIALGCMTQGAQAQDPLVGGYVAALYDGDSVTAMEIEGIADPDSGAAVSMDTVFHVASLSKQITGAALAFAILDGKVSLDDPVAKHIPEAAHYGEALEVGHLLYFTSGLSEAYDLPREGGQPWSTHFHFSVDDAIEASLSVEELQFAPGTEWRYNNINFQLIAEIVERAYEKPFSAVVRERVFEPLGMSASLIHDDVTTVIPNRANGIAPRTAGFIGALKSTGLTVHKEGGPILIRRNAPHYGGSGVMTSMRDWMLWQEEILTRDAFGEAFWDLMVSTRTYEHPKDNDAFGLVHGDANGEPILWFAGSDIDASSYHLVAPRLGRAAACFSNQPGFDCRARANALFDQDR